MKGQFRSLRQLIQYQGPAPARFGVQAVDLALPRGERGIILKHMVRILFVKQVIHEGFEDRLTGRE